MSIGWANHHNWFKAKKLQRERLAQAAERIAKAAEKEAQAAEKEAQAADNGDGAGKTIVRIQLITVAVAVLAMLATAWAAWEARDAVKTSQNIAAQQAKDSITTASQQSAENKLTMAVTAVGSRDPVQQAAGFVLLRSSVQSEMDAATTNPSWRSDAYDAYFTSISVISVFLRDTTTAGRTPPVGAEYAGATLDEILQMLPELELLGGVAPAIDLSHVGLSGADLTGVRFDQLSYAYMRQIDLRGAYLQHSYWGRAYLADAQFQCADLSYADLRYANLAGADLRGANLVGALLPKTLQRTQLVGAVFAPATVWNQEGCLNNKAYSSS